MSVTEKGWPMRLPMAMTMALLGSLPISDSRNRHTPIPMMTMPQTITAHLRRQSGP